MFPCFLTCLITQRQKPKTGRVQEDEILHILKQRQSMPESNSTKLSSFSLPVRAFLFVSKTTYNYLLTVSGFIVKISAGWGRERGCVIPNSLVAAGFSLGTETHKQPILLVFKQYQVKSACYPKRKSLNSILSHWTLPPVYATELKQQLWQS